MITVRAAHQGTVVLAGIDPSHPGRGNAVYVRCDPCNLEHHYYHLEELFVFPTQPIDKGMELGIMGKTGWQYWGLPEADCIEHLHFGIKDLATGKFINPRGRLPLER